MRITTFLVCLAMLACHGSPTEPDGTTLPTGTWSNNGTCLIVSESAVELHAGCGHGKFNRPSALVNGTFEVDGTYRVEVGPVSIDPPPPAHYSGSISGSQLTLKVAPSKDPPMTFTLHLGDPIMCGPACL
jgi:hypothetical protein